MNHLKKASNIEVESWLEEVLELTPYQKYKMSRDETVRFSQFEFYKRKKKTESKLWRLTLLFYPIVWLLLVIFLPLNFLFTGRWGYETKFINWFRDWAYKLGL